MPQRVEHKKTDVIKAIKQNISFLNSIVLLISFTILLINVKFLFTILDYIPTFSVVTMLSIVLFLISVTLYIAKVISKRAIKQIEEYTEKTDSLLISLNQEIEERKTTEEELIKAHNELENRVQERTKELSTAVKILEKEISERKKAEELSQQQINRLNALRSVGRAISSSNDLHLTLDILLDQVTTQLSIDAANILLLNQHTPILEYVVSKGFRTRALKYTKLKLGESYAGRAAIERRIVSIPNLKEELGNFARSELFPSEDFIAYFALPLIAKGRVKGVLELFHRSTLQVEPEWLDFLENIANEASIAIDDASLFEELQRSNMELTIAYDTTIEGWSRAMDLKDKQTEGHTQRVTDITLLIARELGIKDKELVHIRRGALLHDMGKIGVPDNILLKPGPLTPEEWIIMKSHTTLAYEMLYPIEYLRPALDIPYYHHEKWDGTGYPKGLKGKEIPYVVRIFSLVDVFDAICSPRPYHDARPKKEAYEIIKSQTGTHFDPEIADAFLKFLEDQDKIHH